MVPTTRTCPVAAETQAVIGSLVFFWRLTLLDVFRLASGAPRGHKLRALLRNLGGWASNWVIALGQLAANLGDWRSGKWELIHSAIVIEGGRLLEATAPKVRTISLGNRLAHYPRCIIVPPRHTAAIEDYEEFHRWAERVDGMPYNNTGLLGVLYNLGITNPEARFCSELCAEGYQILGFLPTWDQVLRRGKPMPFKPPASFWEPSTLANERGALDWSSAIYTGGKRYV